MSQQPQLLPYAVFSFQAAFTLANEEAGRGVKNTESFSERSAYNTYEAMFWRRIGMKTKEELNALKEEVETLNKKLAELTEEELAQVVGGVDFGDLGDRVFGLSSSIEGGQHQR